MLEERQIPGKRKRRNQVFVSNDDKGSTSEDEHALRALFRQHFEASFKPLESVPPPAITYEVTESPPTEKEIESDWEGISDEEQVKAQVVMYQDPHNLKPSAGNDEFKSFMV